MYTNPLRILLQLAVLRKLVFKKAGHKKSKYTYSHFYLGFSRGMSRGISRVFMWELYYFT